MATNSLSIALEQATLVWWQLDSGVYFRTTRTGAGLGKILINRIFRNITGRADPRETILYCSGSTSDCSLLIPSLCALETWRPIYPSCRFASCPPLGPTRRRVAPRYYTTESLPRLRQMGWAKGVTLSDRYGPRKPSSWALVNDVRLRLLYAQSPCAPVQQHLLGHLPHRCLQRPQSNSLDASRNV